MVGSCVAPLIPDSAHAPKHLERLLPAPALERCSLEVELAHGDGGGEGMYDTAHQPEGLGGGEHAARQLASQPKSLAPVQPARAAEGRDRRPQVNKFQDSCKPRHSPSPGIWNVSPELDEPLSASLPGGGTVDLQQGVRVAHTTVMVHSLTLCSAGVQNPSQHQG